MVSSLFLLGSFFGQNAQAAINTDFTDPTCNITFNRTTPSPRGVSITATAIATDTSGINISDTVLKLKVGAGNSNPVTTTSSYVGTTLTLTYTWTPSTVTNFDFVLNTRDNAGNTGQCSNTISSSCPTISAPTGLTPSGTIMMTSPTETRAFSWSSVVGAVKYLFRIDAGNPSWDGSCTAPDSCSEPLTNSTSFNLSRSYSSYGWWVQTVDAENCQSAATETTITIITPTPTPTPWPAWLKTSGGDVHVNR